MDELRVKGVGRSDPVVPARAAGDPREEAFERALQTQVGKSLPVAILSKYGDGSFLVRVAGNHARMLLPATVEPGTEMPMTVMSASPRPTFQLGTAHGGAAVLADLAPGGYLAAGMLADKTAPLSPMALLRNKMLADAGATLPDDDGGSAPAAISAAGRLITRLLDGGGGAGSAAQISAATPLIGAGTPDPARLASALRENVGHSGLFYESHVGEWSDGKRALPELLREPQMAAPRAGPPDADPATAQLVAQQLVLHEQARLVWQGQVWPGQDMRWEIHKDAPDGGGAGDPDPLPSWRSGLQLRFPLLGDIGATIVVTDGQLHMQLTTGTAGTGELLRAHAGELAAALGAAGNPLSSLDIRATQGERDE